MPAPPNADKPLPDRDSINQLKQGELLYSTEYQAENAEQILVSFILSADGKSARNFNVYMRNVTVINNPDAAPSTFVSEAASSTGVQSTDVIGGHLEYNDDYVHLILNIDGETATGSCSISHYSKGLSFDDMPKIEGMEYQDVPPSLISIAELPVTFAVAARGSSSN